MQRYHQQLFFFTLFIAFIYAEITINDFGPHNGKLSIYDSHVELKAKVTNCKDCNCIVKSDDTIDSYQFILPNDKENGGAKISGLQPHTNYKFTLTCQSLMEHQKQLLLTSQQIMVVLQLLSISQQRSFQMARN
ncbi:hypothetical protein I4U23_008733 [Adineta vaga]|nr:hypothetical protein I4U23_008733 [Adineta vaga]